MVKKPEKWSPDAPRLYTARITYGEHSLQRKFGFRTFEFKPHGPFILNGRRLLLQGTHRHEDHAGVSAAMTDEQIRSGVDYMSIMKSNLETLKKGLK